MEIARRAFILCQDQTRPISRFVSNRYIDFLKLVQKNIDKEKFMEIVQSNNYEAEEDEEEERAKEESDAKEEMEMKKVEEGKESGKIEEGD